VRQVEEFRSAACWRIAGKVKKTLAIMRKTDSAATLGENMDAVEEKPDQVTFPYETDGVTLHCGDNCETMLRMPAESVDLVVTSPPYDDLRTYGGHSWDFYGVAWNLKRLLKPGGVIVWVVNDETKEGSETGTSWRQAHHFQSIGLKIHDTMIYQKRGFSFPESKRYHQVFEYAFVFANGAPKTFNPICDRKNVTAGNSLGADYKRDKNGKSVARVGSYDRGERQEMGQRFNVWDYPAGGGLSGDAIAFKHPAIFPEALARDHILSWSNEGDTVLDPFSGSGTTIKMARETGRRGIGIEINEEYCQIAIERLRQRLLFGMADPE
jgi:site-specific DNA-methyltransferase (adenine-specific)